VSRERKWLASLEVGSRVAVLSSTSASATTIQRETKRYWVTATGARFRKDDGRVPGDYTYGAPAWLADPTDPTVVRLLRETQLRRYRDGMTATLLALGRAPEDLGTVRQLIHQAREYGRVVTEMAPKVVDPNE